jgi:hypothetical protein
VWRPRTSARSQFSSTVIAVVETPARVRAKSKLPLGRSGTHQRGRCPRNRWRSTSTLRSQGFVQPLGNLLDLPFRHETSKGGNEPCSELDGAEKMSRFNLHHLCHVQNEVVYGGPLDPSGLSEAVKDKYLENGSHSPGRATRPHRSTSKTGVNRMEKSHVDWYRGTPCYQ